MKEFQQIIKQYECNNLASFCQNYKDRTVEELEAIILDFQSLYQFGWDFQSLHQLGDDESDCIDLTPIDLIPSEDWTVFGHWEPSTQTDFLAYLAIKIAVLRS